MPGSLVVSSFPRRRRHTAAKNILITIPGQRDRLIRLARVLLTVVRHRRAPMVLLPVPPGRMAHRRVRAGLVDQADLAALLVRVDFRVLAALLAREGLAVLVARPVRVDLVVRAALVVRADRLVQA